MKNLIPLDGDPYEYFKSIRDSKMSPSREHLEGIDKTIKDRYDDYKALTDPNQLEKLSPNSFTNEQEDALRQCYAVKTKELIALKSKIKENQVGSLGAKCQYCGISAPDSFDHYLPKSVFPEYSVCFYNLIPCCPKCNLDKLDDWIDTKSGNRLIINFYFDLLPLEQYLFVELNYDATNHLFSAFFVLDNRFGVDQNLFEIILKHYEKLSLIKRFEPEVRAIFEEVVMGYETHLKDGRAPEDYRTQIAQIARMTKKTYGVNNHKALLYEALAVNDSLFEFLDNVQP